MFDDSPASPQSPDAAWNSTDLRTIIIAKGVGELKDLSDLRKKGWAEEGLDHHFIRQRQLADTANAHMNLVWFNKMKVVFGELDVAARIVPLSGPMQFLDLGCSPGGFSSYILHKNRNARGVGISLPVEQGGHLFALESYLGSRFELHLADLNYYRLHHCHRQLRALAFDPLPQNFEANFDVVILDGHFLRTYLSPALTDPKEWDRHRLLISQIVIALRSIRHGGTIVLKLSHPEKLHTAQFLFMLDGISKSLCVFKPRSLHTNRGTFYAIANGVGLGYQGAKKAEYLRELEELWYQITFVGSERQGRFMTATDLDFIVTYDDIANNYIDRLIDISRNVWSTQADALRAWFSRKGILY
ncbi:hypothetical protein EW146_g3020 [Bondarzewia mesenterica]|uniref:Ribosomal RNA methyltransferase FtsJ domain-containing protein n=1 Tax=Bondarzewia mesenterica TaxID=1095465 RepID=A0A4S4LYZ8_9AGAM|nr:hypothetical protein EW146_g3020 [Bondarzewia mesenterica]